jgi:hypothetical protein
LASTERSEVEDQRLMGRNAGLVELTRKPRWPSFPCEAVVQEILR